MMTKIMALPSIVVLTLLIVATVALPYGKDSGVINLTQKNFADQVFGSEHVWVVEFYAPCIFVVLSD